MRDAPNATPAVTARSTAPDRWPRAPASSGSRANERAGADRERGADPGERRRPFVVQDAPCDRHDRRDDRGHRRDHADAARGEALVEQAEADDVARAGRGAVREVAALDVRTDHDCDHQRPDDCDDLADEEHGQGRRGA